MKSVNCVLGRASVVFAFSIVILLLSFSVNATTVLNRSFTITPDNSANSTAWNLKYSESENAINITMSENKGEKAYTVRSKFFEVAYVVNKNGFGARLIRGNNARVPDQILEKIINQEALINQKVISDAQIDNATALNLIASYLPDLINSNYKHLVQ